MVEFLRGLPLHGFLTPGVVRSVGPKRATFTSLTHPRRRRLRSSSRLRSRTTVSRRVPSLKRQLQRGRFRSHSGRWVRSRESRPRNPLDGEPKRSEQHRPVTCALVCVALRPRRRCVVRTHAGLRRWYEQSFCPPRADRDGEARFRASNPPGSLIPNEALRALGRK